MKTDWKFKTCTQKGFSVGYMSPATHTGPNAGKGAILHVSRTLRGRSFDLGSDRRLFPDVEAAEAFAFEHGYTRIYNHRPNGFIDLRLSPATRRYLRGKSEKEVWALLPRILGGKGINRPGAYFYDVRVKDYMAPTRLRWIAALRDRKGRDYPDPKESVISVPANFHPEEAWQPTIRNA